tara:strand:+ start:1533 stop:1811 length:279 start_codon:yes stop_codon:yes gene_type:complete
MAQGFVDSSLEKFGPFGRYNGVTKVNNATVHFTGSKIGAAAIMLGEASTTGTITLARGGDTVNLAHLTKGVVYEFGISAITCNAKDVYILKR